MIVEASIALTAQPVTQDSLNVIAKKNCLSNLNDIIISAEVIPRGRIKRLSIDVEQIFVLDGFVVARSKQNHYPSANLLYFFEEVYISLALKVVGQIAQQYHQAHTRILLYLFKKTPVNGLRYFRLL